jgi:hypothetical protein
MLEERIDPRAFESALPDLFAPVPFFGVVRRPKLPIQFLSIFVLRFRQPEEIVLYKVRGEKRCAERI